MITTVQITVSRVLTSDGGQAVMLGMPESYSSVEVLGMLEAAKMQVWKEMLNASA